MPTTLPAAAPPQVRPWPSGWRRVPCLALALAIVLCAVAIEALCRDQ